MPEISIIVPVYNEKKYLYRCVNSIINQTYINFELILVDDGSKDGSQDLCDELEKTDKRIKVIHKKNGGLSSARNEGISISKGKYIGFVDSDDWIADTMYEDLFNMITKYECDIASVSYALAKNIEYGKDKKEKCSKEEIKIYEREKFLFIYLDEGMKNRITDFPVWNKLYRKELFDTIRFPVGKNYEDIVTNFLLIGKSKKICKSNKVCYFYFQNDTGITRSCLKKADLDLLRTGKELIQLAKKERNNYLIELAEIKKARAYFSLLIKGLFYGIANDIKQEKVFSYLKRGVMKNYWKLFFSSMPISRKILMTIVCLNVNLSKNILSTYKKYSSIHRGL